MGVNEKESLIIFVHPGQVCFSDQPVRIHTLLGSCISITLWHSKRRLGGLCHYKLPVRVGSASHVLDGSYGDEAIGLLLKYIQDYGSCLGEYEVGLFGGGCMFPSQTDNETEDIGRRNIQLARRVLGEYGAVIQREDVGGRCSRRISMDLNCGEIHLRVDTLA